MWWVSVASLDVLPVSGGIESEDLALSEFLDIAGTCAEADDAKFVDQCREEAFGFFF